MSNSQIKSLSNKLFSENREVLDYLKKRKVKRLACGANPSSKAYKVYKKLGYVENKKFVSMEKKL